MTITPEYQKLVPDSKHNGNMCVNCKAKPINADLNINSHKDELRRTSDGIDPYKGSVEHNILEEALITVNEGVL